MYYMPNICYVPQTVWFPSSCILFARPPLSNMPHSSPASKKWEWAGRGKIIATGWCMYNLNSHGGKCTNFQAHNWARICRNTWKWTVKHKTQLQFVPWTCKHHSALNKIRRMTVRLRPPSKVITHCLIEPHSGGCIFNPLKEWLWLVLRLITPALFSNQCNYSLENCDFKIVYFFSYSYLWSFSSCIFQSLIYRFLL